MSSDETFDFGPERMPIPEAFHSFESGRAFDCCSVCTSAFGETVPYVIEKGFLKGETIYEVAICLDCRGSIRGELSEESKQRIESHLMDRMRFRSFPDEPLSRCVLSDAPLGDEYVICGVFLGGSMSPDMPPFAISAEEMEKMDGLLSKPTRERLDDFVDDVLGIPGLGNPVPIMV